MTDYSHLLKHKIDNRFTIFKQTLGSGSFGTIFLGQIDETEELVAIKAENAKSVHISLIMESKILQQLQQKVGFPVLYFQGEVAGFNVMVFEILGPSLEDLFNLCDRKFSLQTTILIADQLIHRLDQLHSKGYIHRDIKPENFLIGLGKGANIINMIDFGLGKKYRESRNNQHIPYRENKSLVGTARYATINSHLGMEQSRRDDIESIGYLLVYFLKGNLPWQGIKAADKQEKYTKIMEKKISTCPEVLCKGLPIEFSIYLNYARNLKYEERPDYLYLRKMFKELFFRRDYVWDYMFDWCQPPETIDPDDETVPYEEFNKVYTKESHKGDHKLKIVINTKIKSGQDQDQKMMLDGINEEEKQNDDSHLQMIQSDYKGGESNRDDLTPGNEEGEEKVNEQLQQQQEQEEDSKSKKSKKSKSSQSQKGGGGNTPQQEEDNQGKKQNEQVKKESKTDGDSNKAIDNNNNIDQDKSLFE